MQRQFTNMELLIKAVADAAGDATAPPSMRNLVIRFGTLSEYFAAVAAEARTGEPLMTLSAAAAAATDAAGPAASAAAAGSKDAAAAAPAAAAHEGGHSAAAIAFPQLEGDALSVDGGVDFFPYADNGNSWWTGYYVSRPALKQAITVAFHGLRAADSLHALARPWAAPWQAAADALSVEAAQRISRAGEAQRSISSGRGSSRGSVSGASSEASTALALLRATSAAPYGTPAGAAALAAVHAGHDDASNAASAANLDADAGKSAAGSAGSVASQAQAPAPNDGGASAGTSAGFSWSSAFTRLEQARLDGALCLHHDAITGTSRETVVNDYMRRMQDAQSAAAGVATDTASLLLGGLPRAIGAVASAPSTGDASALALPESLSPAPLTHVPHMLPVLRHVSVQLQPQQPAKATGNTLAVAPSTPAQPIVLHNALAWRRPVSVAVLVDLGPDAMLVQQAQQQEQQDGSTAAASVAPCTQGWPLAFVVDADGRPVPSQWVATVEEGGLASTAANLLRSAKPGASGAAAGTLFPAGVDGLPAPALRSDASAGALHRRVRHELHITTEVPGLALSTLFVTIAWNASASVPASHKPAPASAAKSAITGAAYGCAAPSAVAALAAVPNLLARAASTSVIAPMASSTAVAKSSGAAAAPPRLNLLSSTLAQAPQPAEQSSAKQLAPLVLENACLRAEVDASTGLLQAVTYKHAAPDTDVLAAATAGTASGSKGSAGSGSAAQRRLRRVPRPVRMRVAQSFASYGTFQSGAYLFRPTDDPRPLEQRAFDAAAAASAAVDGSGTAPPGVSSDTTVTITRVHGSSSSSSSGSGSGSGPSAGAGASLVQTVRVVGPRYSQTIRLADTLSFWRSDSDSDSEPESSEELAAACADPLLPDATLELLPTIGAGGNEEIVMRLATDVDPAPEGAGLAAGPTSAALSGAAGKNSAGSASSCPAPVASVWGGDLGLEATGLGSIGTASAPGGDPNRLRSPNLRDGYGEATGSFAHHFERRPISAASAASAAAPGAAAATDAWATSGATRTSAGVSAAPMGWWTGDGLGLLRRQPANADVAARDIARHYYPLNAATRVSGLLPQGAATSSGGAGAAAADAKAAAAGWLTVFSAQPLGTTTQLTRGDASRGSRLEIMLHRHLSQDDGRGLATGVIDYTRNTYRLALHVGAELLTPAADVAASAAAAAGGSAGSAPCTSATGSAAPLSPLVAGFGAAHPEWSWAWATRLALHRAAPAGPMHADLAGLRAEMQLARALCDSDSDGAGAATAPTAESSTGDAGDGVVVRASIVPPHDSSTAAEALASALPVSHAEAPVPRAAWLSRFAASFTPLAADAWWLQAPSRACPDASGSPGRCDSYPAETELRGLCAAASGKGQVKGGAGLLPLGVRQICHHLGDDADARAAAAPHSSLSALSGASSGLPPWIHLLTLQARDAVTDDAVLRLHNAGGPSVTVDADAMLGRRAAARAEAAAGDAAAASSDGASSAHAPLVVASWRMRTLTLNRPEEYLDTHASLNALVEGSGYSGSSQESNAPSSAPASGLPSHFYFDFASRGRVAFPSERLLQAQTQVQAQASGTGKGLLSVWRESLWVSLRSAPLEVRRTAGAHLALSGAANVAARFSSEAGMSAEALADSFVSQNTAEAGVFLSDAALEKAAADAAAAANAAAAAGAGGSSGAGRARLLLDAPPAGAAGQQQLPFRVDDRKRSGKAVAARDAWPDSAAAAVPAAGQKKPAQAAAAARKSVGALTVRLRPTHAHMTLAPSSLRSALLSLVADTAVADAADTMAGKQDAVTVSSQPALDTAALTRALLGAPLPPLPRNRKRGSGANSAKGGNAGSSAGVVDVREGASSGDQPGSDAALNAASQELLALIAGVVVDLDERQAMTEAVRAGIALTPAQQRRLLKLSREQHRVHAQARPDNLPSLLAAVLRTSKGATGGEPPSGSGDAGAGMNSEFSPEPPAPPPVPADSYIGVQLGLGKEDERESRDEAVPAAETPDPEGDVTKRDQAQAGAGNGNGNVLTDEAGAPIVGAEAASWKIPGVDDAPSAGTGSGTGAGRSAGLRGARGAAAGGVAGESDDRGDAGASEGRVASAGKRDADLDPWNAEEEREASSLRDLASALAYHAPKRRRGAARGEASKQNRRAAAGEAPLGFDDAAEDAEAAAVINAATAGGAEAIVTGRSSRVPSGDAAFIGVAGLLVAALLYWCCASGSAKRGAARGSRALGLKASTPQSLLPVHAAADGGAPSAGAAHGDDGDDDKEYDDAATAGVLHWIAGALAKVGILAAPESGGSAQARGKAMLKGLSNPSKVS